MVNYLLDTHTLLWMQDDSEYISNEVRGKLSSADSSISLSIVSLWEIIIKQQLHKLKLDYTFDDIVDYCAANTITILPIALPYLNYYFHLPILHKDPFDRLIVATALSEGMTLVSKDKQLQAYNVKILW